MSGIAKSRYIEAEVSGVLVASFYAPSTLSMANS